MIEEETPQLDPEELESNIELWKQQEASCKHMLALKKKANQAECKLGQLYKEQRPQEELNVAIKQNRQSCNALSSYQHIRVAGGVMGVISKAVSETGLLVELCGHPARESGDVVVV
jgi:hypothetical protein